MIFFVVNRDKKNTIRDKNITNRVFFLKDHESFFFLRWEWPLRELRQSERKGITGNYGKSRGRLRDIPAIK